MRILALITDRGTGGGKGGIARFNQDFLTTLSSIPSVEIVALSRLPLTPTLSPSRGEGRVRGGGKMSYAFSALKALYTEGPFDLIFCGHLHLAPLAAFFSKAAKVPCWLQLHGIEVLEKPSFILCWAAKQAELVTAVSRYTRQKFLSWAEISPERVRVLPNTVDPKFQPGPKPEHLLKRYGLAGKKILLTLSRLSPQERYKGQDRILNILPELLRKEPKAVYVIAGGGKDRARLEKMAHEKKLNGAVHFIGPVKESELVDHYRMADLFVMPSTGEGFGIVFLEAAACGIPVVAGSQDGSVDALLEGRLGSLIDPANGEELLQEILHGLASEKANLKPIETFSEKNFASQVKTLLQEIAPWS